MMTGKHRSDPAIRKARRAEGVSWTLVAYLVVAVLAKHYLNVDVTPW